MIQEIERKFSRSRSPSKASKGSIRNCYGNSICSRDVRKNNWADESSISTVRGNYRNGLRHPTPRVEECFTEYKIARRYSKDKGERAEFTNDRVLDRKLSQESLTERFSITRRDEPWDTRKSIGTLDVSRDSWRDEVMMNKITPIKTSARKPNENLDQFFNGLHNLESNLDRIGMKLERKIHFKTQSLVPALEVIGTSNLDPFVNIPPNDSETPSSVLVKKLNLMPLDDSKSPSTAVTKATPTDHDSELLEAFRLRNNHAKLLSEQDDNEPCSPLPPVYWLNKRSTIISIENCEKPTHRLSEASFANLVSEKYLLKPGFSESKN
jgi:hypothetical protein